MSIKYSIRPATEADFIDLLSNMNPMDFQECYAVVQGYVFNVARQMIHSNGICYAGMADDELLCLFGLAGYPNALAATAMPWMLATTNLEDHARPFARHSKFVVQDMLALYPKLFNYVDVRNVLAVKWLKWLGFNFDEAQPYGPLGLPFYRFHKERS